MKVKMVVSGFFISLLLSHALLKTEPAGILLYLALPLPLNIIIFLKAFRDYIDQQRGDNKE